MNALDFYRFNRSLRLAPSRTFTINYSNIPPRLHFPHGCFSVRFPFSLGVSTRHQGSVGWGLRGCDPCAVLQRMFRRCVECAVPVAAYHRYARTGKA
eukprot:scaffold23527_cov61-Phaeocystis_antarctica.AAC.1